MSKVTKFLATLAATALALTGLTAMPALAGGTVAPYTLSSVKSDITSASGDLVAGANRVYWKSGAELWTSDGTNTIKLYTFSNADSFTLTDTTPQYTESGFYDYNKYTQRSAFIGDTVYFWAATSESSTTRRREL